MDSRRDFGQSRTRRVRLSASKVYEVITSQSARRLYGTITAAVQHWAASEDKQLKERSGQSQSGRQHYGCSGTHASKADSQACNRRRAARERGK